MFDIFDTGTGTNGNFGKNKRKGLRVVYGGDTLTLLLVYDALFSDMVLGTASFLIVYVLTYRHLGSIFLTTAGLCQIIGTFPVVFFIYEILVGNLKLGILNVLSIYLVLGIGVDDLFILVDAFKQEETSHGVHTALTLERYMQVRIQT
jgi:hypothetical protein